jgi:isoleucyl-tRNA synthetase
VLHVQPRLAELLSPAEWAEICITSGFAIEPREGEPASFAAAPGAKCERCWRVLPEVTAETGLCRRCEAVVA